MISPVTGTVQQVYYRPGEMVPAGRPIVSILPPGNLKLRFYRAGGDAAANQLRRHGHGQLRQLRAGPHRKDQLHLENRGIHAAGDLQPRRARQAGVPDRGVAGTAGEIPASASRSM